MRRYSLRGLVAALTLAATSRSADAQNVRQQELKSEDIRTARPFGTLQQQADVQQAWLARRLTTVLPSLMRKYGIDMWVIPMREYNEDPVFTSLVSATTFAARRRTIYVFFDQCAHVKVAEHVASAAGAKPCEVERIALGGTSQGGVFKAVRSTKAAAGPAGGNVQAQAELWGDEQWQVLKKVVQERSPKTIGVDISRTFAFTDGLSAGELEGMSQALGPTWTRRFKRAEGLPLDLIATRLPEEAEFYRHMQELVWAIIDTAFSNVVIKPGITRTSDVVWWMRQRVNDLGLGTWFHPSVEVQRNGASDAQLGDDPVIQKGDVLHCDFGITALRLNTDTQHMGYVLRDGETEPPAGLQAALVASNKLQDIVMSEIKPGRTGNEILKASLARARTDGIDGTVYTHPIGMHGHGAGPLIGLWDYQDGVPGRGDAKVVANSWYSIELQATSAVPEWNGQRVRSAQEEDMVMGDDGVPRWALKRQTEYHLVRPAVLPTP